MVVVLILAVALVIVRFSTPEDTWICVNNQWVKHGNPSAPMPQSGCGEKQNTGGDTQIANPASVYCEEQGGASQIVTAADGSQSGICKFPDGRQCDEWDFFRSRTCAQNQGN